MNYNLADFYSNEKIPTTSDLIESRERSISRLSEKLTAELIYEITCVFFGIVKPKADCELVKYFREDDKSFSIVDNERELSLLASYVLYTNLEKNKRLHLAIITTGFNGYNKPSCSAFINNYIIDSFRVKVLESRKQNSYISINYPDDKFEGLEIPDDETVQFIASDITAVLKEQRYYFDNLTVAFNKNLSTLKDEIRFIREESDMLWWLTRSYSETFETDFSKLPTNQALIASALELAEITTTALGPASIDRIIIKAASNAKNKKNDTPFKDLIELLPEAAVNNDRDENTIASSPAFFPVLYALHKKKVIGGEYTWCKKYNETLSGNIDQLIDPLLFSLQVYREKMLLRMIS